MPGVKPKKTKHSIDMINNIGDFFIIDIKIFMFFIKSTALPNQ